jgi:hypothetical protein
VSDTNESIGDGTKPFPGWKQSAGTAKRRKNSRGRRPQEHVATISITSLTDMVTVLLVY